MKTLRRFLGFLLIVLIITLIVIVIIRITQKETIKEQVFDYLPHSSNNEIVVHTGYTLSYIDKYEEPEWVAYKLSQQMLGGQNKRTNEFIPDPEVPSGSALAQDYSGSGYDRGHLCPAADMNSSPELMKESFYMSNMCPQAPSFNRGIWSKLEKTVRMWADEDGLIYIVSGPIFSSNMRYIGRSNKVAVPPEFYKVILCYNPDHEAKAIGFIIPNKGSAAPLTSFVVSVDSVESRTGIDFYPHLPDDIEQKVEKRANPEDWDFNKAAF